MRQFWRWIRRHTEATHDQALLQRLDKAERQVTIAEDTISGLIGQVEDLTRESKKAKDCQALAEAKVKELETALMTERVSIPHRVQRAEDKAILAQAKIGALEAELAKAREELGKLKNDTQDFRRVFFKTRSRSESESE